MNRERRHAGFCSFLRGNSRWILSCAVLLMLCGCVFSAGCFGVSSVPDNMSLSLSEVSGPGMTGVLNFSGIGNYQTEAVYLSGVVTVLAETSGDGPFILSLQSSDGLERVLFDEPGPFGESPRYFVVSLEIPAENYMFSVVSPGSWNVSAGPGEKAFFSLRSEVFVLTGTGSQMVELPQMSDGITVLRGYCPVPGNLSVDVGVNESVIRRLHADLPGGSGIQAAYPLSSSDSCSLNITADTGWVLEITQPVPEHPLRFDAVSGTGRYVSALYAFSDVHNQELSFSNAGNSPVTVTLYTAEGVAVKTVSVPAHTRNMHQRLSASPRQVIPCAALIAVSAEDLDQWRIEQCEYRICFQPVNGGDSFAAEVPGPASLDVPAFTRFLETGCTAAYVPAAESEIQWLMQSNITLIECGGRYYSVTISG